MPVQTRMSFAFGRHVKDSEQRAPSEGVGGLGASVPLSCIPEVASCSDGRLDGLGVYLSFGDTFALSCGSWCRRPASKMCVSTVAKIVMRPNMSDTK
eukprot:scaffold97077_cov61-Phaeocystis_antarctica.AAC.2